MRIVFSLIASGSYGAMTSARNLISGVAKVCSEHKFLFLVRPEIMRETNLYAPNIQFEVCSFAAKGTINRILWEHLVLNSRLSRWKADILFINTGTAPLNVRVPFIVAPQNMEPLFNEIYITDHKKKFKGKILARWTYWSVEKALGVIAVSEFMRETLLAKTTISPQKIRIMYPGCPAIEQADQIEFNRFRKERGIDGEYILSASKFIPYSNLYRLVKGYFLASREVDTIPPLVIAGGDSDLKYRHQIELFIRENGLGDRVKLLGFIPHRILMSLMKTSYFFCFPSLLEACPFTILECLSTGTCILSSSARPMPEIGGNAAIYFDPYSEESIAANLLMVLQFSDQEMELWRTKGLQRAQTFKWEDYISSLTTMIAGMLPTKSIHM